MQMPVIPPGLKIYRDLPYVANGHPRQKLDLYLPDVDRTAPLLIWIHGGAWREGSKEMDPPLDYLAQGYALASVNYRLSQHAIFPAQIEDCKAAVRWLRVHAAVYRLDAERFAAWGPSAGGHLAALLGVTGRAQEFETGENRGVSSRVHAVVDYFGPTDLLQMDAHRIPDGMPHNLPDSPESQLVGGFILDVPDRVARANPLNYVTCDAPPFLIVHGDADPTVPYHQSILLETALQKAGVPVTFYTVRGGGHGGFNDPEVDRLTREFLDRHLRPIANG